MKKTPPPLPPTILRPQIHAEAKRILEAYPNNPEIARQVEALMNSLDDTLTDPFILGELLAIKESGATFQKTIATNVETPA